MSVQRLRRALVLLALPVYGAGAGVSIAAAHQTATARSAASVNVPQLLAKRVTRVKQHDGGVAVLLPATMPLDTPDFTASSASKGNYTLEIDGAKNCDGANVCLFALFMAQRGGKLFGKPVSLTQGVHGAFKNITCGASCSPAAITWIEHGVRYEIQANPSIEAHPNVSTKTLRAVFVAAANSAIQAGPR
jgi:hypothetical protein